MKKALTVILWLGLGISLVLLITFAGQKNTYHEHWQNAQRKNEVLQTLYEEDKEEWEGKLSSLQSENKALAAENKLLTNALDAAEKEIQTRTDAEQQAAEALDQAQTAWEAQRQGLEAERDAVSDRISDVLALLLTPMPGLNAEEAEAETETEAAPETNLFASSGKPLLPALPSPDLNRDMVYLME